MANAVEKVNGIALLDIENINGITDDNLEDLNGLEFLGQTFTAATGGTVTTDGDYKVHVFNSSGTFAISSVGTDITYLVISGGGGGGATNGGSSQGGSGGGAGAYRTATDYTPSGTGDYGTLVIPLFSSRGILRMVLVVAVVCTTKGQLSTRVVRQVAMVTTVAL